MTEEEARTKWCFAAVASHTDPRQGFHENSGGMSKVFPCLGSACMAWRWSDHINSQPEIGYCGLAGKP